MLNKPRQLNFLKLLLGKSFIFHTREKSFKAQMYVGITLVKSSDENNK